MVEPRMASSLTTRRNSPAPVCEAEMKRLASRRLTVLVVLAVSKALTVSRALSQRSLCTTATSCFSRSLGVVLVVGVVRSDSGLGSSRASGSVPAPPGVFLPAVPVL